MAPIQDWQAIEAKNRADIAAETEKSRALVAAQPAALRVELITGAKTLGLFHGAATGDPWTPEAHGALQTFRANAGNTFLQGRSPLPFQGPISDEDLTVLRQAVGEKQGREQVMILNNLKFRAAGAGIGLALSLFLKDKHPWAPLIGTAVGATAVDWIFPVAGLLGIRLMSK